MAPPNPAAPLPQLPSVQLGNTASDISSGAGNLIAGLLSARQQQYQRGEQEKRDALSQALAQSQMGNITSEEQARIAQQGFQQQQLDIQKQGAVTAAAQFEKMFGIHQRLAAAEEMRARAAMTAASARLPAMAQSQLRYLLNNVRANLANLRSMSEQEMKNNPMARMQYMKDGTEPYAEQIAEANNQFDDITRQMEEGGVTGGAGVKTVSPPVSPYPGNQTGGFDPFGGTGATGQELKYPSGYTPLGQSNIHGGATNPANATPVPATKPPVAGTNAGANKHVVTNPGAAGGGQPTGFSPAQLSRYTQLRDQGYSPEQARAQLSVEGVQ